MARNQKEWIESQDPQWTAVLDEEKEEEEEEDEEKLPSVLIS